MKEQQLQAIVQVRCATCLRRYGAASRLGEMLLLPPGLGGKWGWTPIVRWMDTAEVGRQRTVRRSGRLHFGGGVEVKCRRCRTPHRFKISRLARLAQETHSTEGSADILI